MEKNIKNLELKLEVKSMLSMNMSVEEMKKYLDLTYIKEVSIKDIKDAIQNQKDVENFLEII